MTYPYVDPQPYDHQRHWCERTWGDEYHAFFWEQRTAKSRPCIDTAARNYLRGHIDCMVVLAPNGVHIQWVQRELAAWAPRGAQAAGLAWRSGRMGTRLAKEQLGELLHHDGLTMIALNWEALLTNDAQLYLKTIFKHRKVLAVADESDDLGSPGARRTRVAMRVGARSTMRRILTGTPAAEGPLKLYSQTNFLKWGLLGFTSFYAYKHHFAVWEPGYNSKTEEEYESVVAYQNIQELNDRLRSFSSFVTRKECGAQLPREAERVFVLTKRQRQAYDDLREQYQAEVEEGRVTATHVLTRWTRLQQIASGFVPVDRDPIDCPRCDGTDDACPTCDGLGLVLPEPRVADFGNPRLEALEAELRGRSSDQVVIWARFTPDVEAICRWMRGAGKTFGRCDGTVGADERLHSQAMFQAGNLQHIVAQPQAVSRGSDYSAARTDIFYSHHWSLRLRLQAQDRVETLKDKRPVTHVNLVADNTVDVDITGAHAAKRSISGEVTAHPERRWF